MEEEHFTLITNIDCATHAGLFLSVHALLLEDQAAYGGLPGRRYQLRGFGADGAWPVFARGVDTSEFSLTEAGMFRCGAAEIQLARSDGDHPFRVDRFAGLPDARPVLRVWEVLTDRVAQYWTAPAMPGLVWAPPAQIVQLAARQRIRF